MEGALEVSVDDAVAVEVVDGIEDGAAASCLVNMPLARMQSKSSLSVANSRAR